MAKKVLIIITEADRGDMGLMPKGSKDIPDGTCHVSNLISQVAALPGVEVETMFYADVTPAAVDAVAADCIIASGRLKEGTLEEIPVAYASFLDFLRHNNKYPYLGICFGHQLLSLAHGVEIRHMSEDLTKAEAGYTKIDIQPCAALFRDLASPICCMESHHDEISAVPAGFQLVASTAVCERQAIAHQSWPVYGVQFHPEFYSAEHPDGMVILQNFIGLR